MTVSVACALLFAGNYLVEMQQQLDDADQRDQAVQFVAGLRARIEGELNATGFLAQGLVAYINARGPMDEGPLHEALASLYTAGRNIVDIAIAPNNRIQYVYPTAGNERAIGLDFSKNLDQWPAVSRAMQTRQTVLTGPVNLVQGGVGLITRTPVYYNDGTYWGLVSIVIDLPGFLRSTGFDGMQGHMRVVLRGADVAGDTGGLIAGDASLPTDVAVTMAVGVPGGTWELSAMPVSGWGLRRTSLLGLRVLIYGTAIVIAVLVGYALYARRQASIARATLQASHDRLTTSVHELEHLSETDPLTGIPNRRGLDEVLTLEWRRTRRQDLPLTLLMIDIDYFKPYNDLYGHLRGDECLRSIAAIMQSTAHRAGEFLARSGGEEFVMVLPAVDLEAGRAQAERLRSAVEAARIEHSGSEVSAFVTVSIGVATREPSSLISLDGLREAADSALYAAKRGGRNRVSVADTSHAQEVRFTTT